MKDMRKLEEIWAKFVYEDELDRACSPPWPTAGAGARTLASTP